MERLTATFFERDVIACARDLIGVRFAWHGCEGRIVETEAYVAEGDPACHTFFRPGARAFVKTHPAGSAYVYLNYGIHWLFNVLVKGPGAAGFVLFRALEPVTGIDRMIARRRQPGIRDLCSGPGKLTQALAIDGTSHGTEFLEGTETALFRGTRLAVVAGPRVGISKARDFPWRFHEQGNRCVSR